MRVAQGGLDANLRAGGAQCSQSALYWEGLSGSWGASTCAALLVLAVVPPVLLPVSPAAAFLRSIFMNVCFNREN